MTTRVQVDNRRRQLWFAQNSLPLWLKWQPSAWACAALFCCDLLKIHYLCGWNDNFWTPLKEKSVVVICSKFITFVVEMTTITVVINVRNMLWFAQNSLPLWLKWQRIGPGKGTFNRCDLLKIHYLCGWNDNEVVACNLVLLVVICSKFITFVVEMTTVSCA